MATPLATEHSPSYQKLLDNLRKRQPSPRVRNALRLYASGAVKSKKEAAEAVGLSPQALYTPTMPSLGDTPTRRLMNEIDAALDDKTVDMSRVLAMLSRKAVKKINSLMDNSENEHIQLKAAVDLADRAPETSKTHKVAVANIRMNSDDAKELAAAMVESARARREFAHVAEGDFVQVTTDADIPLPKHAKRVELVERGSNQPESDKK